MRMHNIVIHMLPVWLMQCAYAYARARNNIQCRFQLNVRCDTLYTVLFAHDANMRT